MMRSSPDPEASSGFLSTALIETTNGRCRNRQGVSTEKPIRDPGLTANRRGARPTDSPKP